MTRVLIVLTGLAGFGIVARAADYYRGVDSLAFGVTLAMGVALFAGLAELWVRAGVIARLDRGLRELPKRPESLDDAPVELRSLLRSHLERDPMPAKTPIFAPYLIGLLVMLGLLGTFLGLFETLRGAREALASSGDVDALRAGLSTPMGGLMRSFGTSAAGVASSAMLGLGSVFTMRAARALDRAIHHACSGTLAHLSAARRQLDALEALAEQGEALPSAAAALRETVASLKALEASTVERAERERDVLAEQGARLAKAVHDELAKVGATLEEVDVRATARAAEAQAAQDARASASTEALLETHQRVQARMSELDAQWRQQAEQDGARFESHAAEVASHAKAQLDTARSLVEEAATRTESERVEAGRAIAAATQSAQRAMESSVEIIGARLDAVGESFGEARVADAELFANRSEALLARIESLETGLGDAHAAAAAEVREVMGEGIAAAARAAAETVEPTVARIVSATERSAAAHLEALREQLDTDQQARRDRDAETLAAMRTHLDQVVAALDATRVDRQEADAASAQATADATETILSALASESEARAAVSTSLLNSVRTQADAALEAQAERAQTLVRQLAEDAAARAATERSLLETLEALTSTAAQAEAARAAESTRLAEAADARWSSLAEDIQDRDTARAEAWREFAQSVQGGLSTATQELSAALAKGSERDASRVEALEGWLGRFEATHEKVSSAAREQTAAVDTLAEGMLQRTLEAEQRMEGRLETLVESVGQSVAAQAARLAEFERSLESRNDQHAEALTTQLVTEATRLNAGLESTGEMVRDAAALVKSGGAELSAAVEMFTGAVEQHGEAAQRWLGGLAEVERSVEEAGEEAAVEVLGQYLARTHELFDQQLGFQQELYEQLKSARGVPDVHA